MHSVSQPLSGECCIETRKKKIKTVRVQACTYFMKPQADLQ